jgi:hypothetical protein
VNICQLCWARRRLFAHLNWSWKWKEVCWGVRKSDEIPEHNIPEQAHGSKNGERTRNPWKYTLASKVVNPFIRALMPPFIGRRRDFYIPRTPNLENISSVNMYMNVFYILWFAGLISHIYKPATVSHFEPGLFEATCLTFFLWPSDFHLRKSSIIRISGLNFRTHSRREVS